MHLAERLDLRSKTHGAKCVATCTTDVLSRWAVTPADALSITISTAVKRRRDMRICPDAAHLFIDVLAKICYIEDATSIVEARISQVFSQTLEHGERYLPFVHIHNKHHCRRNSDDCRLAYLCTLNCAILNNFRLFNFRFLTRTITSEPKVGLANFNQSEMALGSERTPQCA